MFDADQLLDKPQVVCRQMPVFAVFSPKGWPACASGLADYNYALNLSTQTISVMGRCAQYEKQKRDY